MGQKLIYSILEMYGGSATGTQIKEELLRRGEVSSSKKYGHFLQRMRNWGEVEREIKGRNYVYSIVKRPLSFVHVSLEQKHPVRYRAE